MGARAAYQGKHVVGRQVPFDNHDDAAYLLGMAAADLDEALRILSPYDYPGASSGVTLLSTTVANIAANIENAVKRIGQVGEILNERNTR